MSRTHARCPVRAHADEQQVPLGQALPVPGLLPVLSERAPRAALESVTTLVEHLLAISRDRPARVEAISAVSLVQRRRAHPQEGEQSNDNHPDNLDDGHYGSRSSLRDAHSRYARSRVDRSCRRVGGDLAMIGTSSQSHRRRPKAGGGDEVGRNPSPRKRAVDPLLPGRTCRTCSSGQPRGAGSINERLDDESAVLGSMPHLTVAGVQASMGWRALGTRRYARQGESTCPST